MDTQPNKKNETCSESEWQEKLLRFLEIRNQRNQRNL